MATKQLKWAQMTKEERAYEKAEAAGLGHSIMDTRIRGDRSTSRQWNRYYQLLGHWTKLKKANDAQSSI